MTREEDNGAPGETAQTEARDAIAAFEEILDVFPTDVDTLDALAQSYHLVGEHENELQYLKRLVRVLLDQGDQTAAAKHMGRLEPMAGQDTEAQALLSELRSLGFTHDTPEQEEPPVDDARPTGIPRDQLGDRAAVTDEEMTLAWALKEAGIFPDEEYASVVKDLTEISGQDSSLTISVLHILQDRASRNLDPALAYIAKESRRPPAPIENIEMNEDTARLLPIPVQVAEGVALFDQVGPELLVAAINPLRKGLREQLENQLGRRCHLFSVHPASLDGWIARAEKTFSENAD